MIGPALTAVDAVVPDWLSGIAAITVLASGKAGGISGRGLLKVEGMRQILSQFHYMTLFVDGGAFTSAERLHEELAFKLGLPKSYGRNWDAFLDCLSSIDDPASNLCSHWTFRAGKRLVLEVREFSAGNADPDLLLSFAQAVSDANERLRKGGTQIAIWIEFNQRKVSDGA